MRALILTLLLFPIRAWSGPIFEDEFGPVSVTSQTLAVVPSILGANYVAYTVTYSTPSSSSKSFVHYYTSSDGISWSLGSLDIYNDPDDEAVINGIGVLPLSAGGFRIFYSVITHTGAAAIKSALSVDGGDPWVFEKTHLSGGGVFLDPKPVKLPGQTATRLFYVNGADAENPSTWNAQMISSFDEGFSFFPFVTTLGGPAGGISATALSDNKRTRVYYVAVDNVSATQTELFPKIPFTSDYDVFKFDRTQIKSFLSQPGGSLFFPETGIRYSTNTNLDFSAAYRVIAQPWRWRMIVDKNTIKTFLPDPQKLDPVFAFKSDPSVTITVTGDILAPTLTASLSGPTAIPLTINSVPSDLSFIASFVPTGQPLGFYDLIVNDPSGKSTTLSGAFEIQFSPGKVDLLDNLFFPERGERVKIDVFIFNAGNIKSRLYTITGAEVASIVDQEFPEGLHTFYWDGKTAAGNLVASGLYLLQTNGPRLDNTSKVIVVK